MGGSWFTAKLARLREQVLCGRGVLERLTRVARANG